MNDVSNSGKHKRVRVPPEQREKIRQSRIEAWKLYYATLGKVLPPTKRCTKCRKIKKVDPDPKLSEFSLRKKSLNKSGVIYVAPVSECKECAAERAKKNRDSKSPEERTAIHKRHNANRNRRKVNKYNREYGRLRRLEQGVTPRGPWKKYKHELSERTRVVLIAPKVWEYLRKFYREEEINVSDGGKTQTKKIFVLNGRRVEGSDQRLIFGLKSGQLDTISLDRMDQLATDYSLPLWEIVEAGRELQLAS